MSKYTEMKRDVDNLISELDGKAQLNEYTYGFNITYRFKNNKDLKITSHLFGVGTYKNTLINFKNLIQRIENELDKNIKDLELYNSIAKKMGKRLDDSIQMIEAYESKR